MHHRVSSSFVVRSGWVSHNGDGDRRGRASERIQSTRRSGPPGRFTGSPCDPPIQSITQRVFATTAAFAAGTVAGAVTITLQISSHRHGSSSGQILCSSFRLGLRGPAGEVPKRPNGADCKSAVYDFGGSNPPLSTIRRGLPGLGLGDGARSDPDAGIAQLARARAFQARGRGFESRFPLQSQPGDGEPRTSPTQRCTTTRRRLRPRSSGGRARPW